MDRIAGVIVTPLAIINGVHGQVRHGIKLGDTGYEGFGEAYFSTVNQGSWKGWKKHTRMTLNLIVVSGEIRFLLYDDRETSETYGRLEEHRASLNNYRRTTIPPGIWVAFSGVHSENVLLNVASIPHDPNEAEVMELVNPKIKFDNW